MKNQKIRKTIIGLMSISTLCCLADGNFAVSTNDTVVTVKAVSGSIPVFTEPFSAVDVSKVVFDAERAFKYTPAAASTYEGGSEVSKGQLYVGRGDAFGSGEIVLGTVSDAALMVRDIDLVISNKVVFPRSNSYATGFGDTVGNLTLLSVGTAGSQYHSVRLGRASQGGVGRVTLSLMDPDSEAISRMILQGALKLILDGGTVKVRSDVNDPFFSVAYAADHSDITVASKGIAFDVPAETILNLGEPLKFVAQSITNVVETCTPTNPGFEDGKTDNWTYTTLSGGETDSAIKTTPNAWDGSGANPPIGKKFAMIRRLVSLHSTVDVPHDGLWRVVFYRGGRTGGYSSDVSLDVAVDDVTNHFPATSVLDFTQYRTPPFELVAGPHTLAFVTSDGGSGHSLNIDEISLERVEVADITGTLAKTGEGTLALDGQDLDGVPVTVLAGTLKAADMVLEGERTTVQGGGELLVQNSTVADGAVVEVAFGGTFTVSGFGDELVVNGSFEDDGAKDYDSSLSVAPKGWRCSRDVELTSNSGYGLQRNGGALSATIPSSPYGKETVYLRECQSVYQTNDVPVSGAYRLTLASADRKYANSQKVPFQILIDGVVVKSVGERPSYAEFTTYTVDVDLTAGKHELRIQTLQGNNQQGNILVFDAISLRRIVTVDQEIPGTVVLAPGATLNADIAGTLRLQNLMVDGVKISGGKSALVKVGVTVVGCGTVKVGEARGMKVIFR